MKKRVNYDFERRKKELDRQRKKDQKREEKLQRKQDAQRLAEQGTGDAVSSDDGMAGSTEK
ncbi:MAG: hypothetical protein ABS52_02715 [Gemmatimonadetes bacterium SCN 70-22]|nr:MAG: hypothetical protein ABS52_02715 [Gemmatimonadetes bacterium SCN 70-22]